jgi:CDP-paratose 2-epimerase
MRLLITGGCGFLGSNLASAAMRRGIEPVIFDNLSRLGAETNRQWLSKQGAFRFVQADVRDSRAVAEVVRHTRPDALFHLAGQVAMTTSLADPRLDFEINALGTFNVLAAVREHMPECVVVYSSTNKVYGGLDQFSYEDRPTRYVCVDRPSGFDEATPLEFHSPYGCSKGAADQYALDWARMFGLRTVVFRHSSMYGGRQFATFDQGWIGWFAAEAMRVERGDRTPVRIAGSGKQVRDVLHADDMVDLYFRAAERGQEIAGQAFNIGGGMANSLSLLELFALLERYTEVTIPLEAGPPRHSDQKVFVADIAKANRLLGWRPSVSAATGIARMLDWSREIASA